MPTWTISALKEFRKLVKETAPKLSEGYSEFIQKAVYERIKRLSEKDFEKALNFNSIYNYRYGGCNLCTSIRSNFNVKRVCTSIEGVEKCDEKKKWQQFLTIHRHRIRISILLLSMFFQLGVLILGSAAPLPQDRADDIFRNLQLQPFSLESITVHNMKVTAFVFLPLFGVLWMAFVGFNTGIVMKAVAMSTNQSTTSLFFAVSILPHYWLENFAYSTALTAGIMLLLAFSTSKISLILHEIKYLIVSLATWALLLTFAGFLEIIPGFLSFMLWVIIAPLTIVLLERASENTIGYSTKFVLSATLILYFSLMYPFFAIFFSLFSFSFHLFPVTLYTVLGYYAAENLSLGWFRRKCAVLR